MFTNDFPVGEFPALPPAVIEQLHNRALMAQLFAADVVLRATSWFPRN